MLVPKYYWIFLLSLALHSLKAQTSPPPASIQVLITGNEDECANGNPNYANDSNYPVSTVALQDYVRDVLPNEWIKDLNWDLDALKAGAMVVKNYGWYYALNKKYSFTSGAGGVHYDVRDSDCDQVYKLNSGASSADFLSASEFTEYSAAVDETFNWVVLEGGAVFLTHFDEGSPGSTAPSVAGYLSQYGTEVLALDGEVWQDILNFYFPSVTVQEISVNPSSPQIVSVVDCAAYGSKLSPGDIFCVFGQNLSLSTGGATTIPLAPSLNGTTILVNGIAAPILWTSPDQVNAQLPFETSVGIASLVVQVANAATVSSQSVTVNVSSPGMFTSTANGITIGAIEHAVDGSLVNSSSPAKPGETISIYLTGLGATTPAVQTGQAGSGQATVLTPTVSIGGQAAQVSFSGLTTYPGLYQINTIIPNLPSGNAQVLVSSAGNASQAGVLVPVAGSSTSQSLIATLTGNPQNGQAPITVTLTAGAGGTATGTINYTFYCNRPDQGTNITSGYVAKFDGVTANPQPAVCAYPTPGTYTAKVIVERGIGAAQATQTITVTGATLPPPVITSVQPSNTSAGPLPQNISIVGSAFQPGLSLTLTPPSGSPQTFTGGQLQNFSSSTFQISAVLSITGSWGIRVANPDGQSATAFLSVSAEPSLTFNFTTWPPVFTLGDPPATIGLQITNVSGGFASGTVSASTSNGLPWLTVDGHTSDTWTIVPSSGSLTTSVSLIANPAGLIAGTYNGLVVVNAPNAVNAMATIPVNMTILTPLQITTMSLPPATWGQSYSYQLQASGGTGYSWSLGPGSTLPPYLTLSSSGLISGTLVGASGNNTYPLTVLVTDSRNRSQYANLILNVETEIAVTVNGSSSFEFVLGRTYVPPSGGGNSIGFKASGGTPPYSWSGSGLPPGLNIDAPSGTVVGTPTQPGTFAVTITATDSTGRAGSANFNLGVVPTPLTITSATDQTSPTLPTGTVGTSYSQFLAARGGSDAGYQWSVTGLPTGLSGNTNSNAGCNSSCLQIVGTPTQAGSYMLTVTVTDSLNGSATAIVLLAINSEMAPTITSSNLPLAKVGSSYSFTFSASGGAGGYSWSIVGSSPDPGLTLSPEGVLSGTSTVPNDCYSNLGRWVGNIPPFGSFSPMSFVVQVTDAAGQSTAGNFCLPAYYQTPVISGVTPTQVPFNGPPTTVTIQGSNFMQSTQVSIEGSFVNTTYVSPTALTILVAPGYAAGQFTSGSYTLWVVEPYAYPSAQMVTFTVN